MSALLPSLTLLGTAMSSSVRLAAIATVEWLPRKAVSTFHRLFYVNGVHIKNPDIFYPESEMEQSLLGFRAANPDWHPSDPVASLFLSRVGAAETTSPRQRQGAYAKENGGGGSAGGGGGGAVASSSYTPANSTLAQRSQLYNEAFERSISLAKPGNAAALQASAIKTGPRSHAHTAKQPNKTLQAVHEDDDAGPLAFTTARLSEVDEEETGESGYADARFGRSTSLHRAAVDGSIAGVGAAGDDTSLRGLLNHIGGRW